MSIRTKSLLLFGVVLLILLVVLIGISKIIISRSFLELEKAQANKNVKCARNIYLELAEQINTFAYDWACWDDTYNFIVDRNQEYIEVNLLDDTFSAIGLNVIIFSDINNSVIFKKAYDLNNKISQPVPKEMELHMPHIASLLESVQSKKKSIQGLVYLSEGILLVAARPILHSNETGPSRGILLFGRFLDDALVDKIRRITSADISFIKEDSFPDSEIRNKILLQDFFIQNQDSSTMDIYCQIKDLYNKPIIIMKIIVPRKVNLQKIYMEKLLIMSILLTCLLFGLLILVLLEFEVISPISKLESAIKEIQPSADIKHRLPIAKGKELAGLARSFNTILDSLKLSQLSLQESEQKYKSFIEKYDGIAYRGGMDFSVVYMHGSIEIITGYSKEDFMSGKIKWQDIIYGEDIIRITESTRQIPIKPEETVHEEYRIIRKNGEIKWIQDLMQNIYDEAGKPIMVQGLIRDITERKQREKDILEVSETEQRRIGQDLHDGLGQKLTGLAFQCKELQLILKDKALPEHHNVTEIVKGINESIRLTRSIARGLCPVELETGGLSDALQHMALKIEEVFKIPCVYSCDTILSLSDRNLSLHLFRIAQEAINNIIKYGGVESIELELYKKNNIVFLEIKNKSKINPDINELNNPKYLQFVKYRADLIGAKIEIREEENQWIVISCIVQTDE
ncbi:CHASE4 domain-containing protein [Planctomycetota bacterium]